MSGEVYDALHLRILWHLHAVQSCFCYRNDGGGEDWMHDIVEVLIEIARGKASLLCSSGPALSLALISCSAGCASGFIFILRGILGQIIF
jgi:hypothetical protein